MGSDLDSRDVNVFHNRSHLQDFCGNKKIQVIMEEKQEGILCRYVFGHLRTRKQEIAFPTTLIEVVVHIL